MYQIIWSKIRREGSRVALLFLFNINEIHL
jgi:hypothetical protein